MFHDIMKKEEEGIMSPKQKFATQVDPELLAKTKKIAHDEGRQLQSVIEEALSDLVEKRSQLKPRAHIMAHYEASVAQFSPLYEKLAK
jgi:predicted transcriptional regulator